MAKHPGTELKKLIAGKKSVAELAADIGVPENRLFQIIAGKRSMTANTALRLAHAGYKTARYWLDLQSDYDLAQEQERI